MPTSRREQVLREQPDVELLRDRLDRADGRTDGELRECIAGALRQAHHRTECQAAPLLGQHHEVEEGDALQALVARSVDLVGHDDAEDVAGTPGPEGHDGLELERVPAIVDAVIRRRDAVDEVERHQRCRRIGGLGTQVVGGIAASGGRWRPSSAAPPPEHRPGPSAARSSARVRRHSPSWRASSSPQACCDRARAWVPSFRLSARLTAMEALEAEAVVEAHGQHVEAFLTAGTDAVVEQPASVYR